MRIFFLSLVSFFLCIQLCGAQQATWSNSVASIIYNNCSTCHRDEGIAPFALMSYTDATGHAAGIKHAVQTGEMPPWPANSKYQRYAHERLLSPQEINDIINWVDGGTPEGNTSEAPAPPVFSNTAAIATPDLSVRIPEYTSSAQTEDVYRCFVVPTHTTATHVIQDIEVLPGNTEIVHHVLIYVDMGSICTSLDSADAGPGYDNLGGTGDANSKLVGGWVPGQGILQLPEGFGYTLPPGAKLVLQIHYPAGSAGQKDSTRINLRYSEAAKPREVYLDNPLNNFTSSLKDGPLYIPANTKKTFHEEYLVTADVTAFNALPHMHLIGHSIRSYGVTPTGDTLRFVDIPHWDFHWQGQYTFRRPMKVPKGTMLYAVAEYDNTTANHDNPNNPPKDVYAGEGTGDEMMMVFFTYALYQPGDEDIIVDSTLLGINDTKAPLAALKLYPNPATDKLQLLGLNPSQLAHITITDMQGRACISALRYSQAVDISALPPGMYLVSIHHKNAVAVRKLVVE